MTALTMRQANFLAVIKALILERGIPPTLRDLSAATGIRSVHGINCYLKALEKKGYISRTPMCARSIRVVEGKTHEIT